jgi:hypothetical protein
MLQAAEHDADEPRTIQPGDMVIVYERYDSMKSLTVSQKGRYNNRWGSFPMKVASACSSCCKACSHAVYICT